MATRNLIFDIFAIDRASAVFSKVGTEAELSGSKMAEAGRKAASGFIEAAAIIGFGTASVKAASDFQASMQRIQTLAMGGKAPIADLSKQVLALSGQVGYDPKSLAEALYHIESNFYSVGLGGSAAMRALTVASKGAQIGGADLVDVTNALGAAIASGIPGVHNYRQAMQMLLTTVGSGDMQMQDLADAFSTGILAVAKQYGVTLNDVSAALATFGDNNIRGQVAATDLRMAVMDLTKQSMKGEFALSQIGIKAGELGKALQQGGLNAAIIDLRNHLDAAGIKGVQVGQFLEEAFTKKSSAPLAILMGQFDRLESKYQALRDASGGFDAAWAARQKTSAQNFADLNASLDTFKVSLGDTIIPVLTKFTSEVATAFTWMSDHQSVITGIAGALGAALVPALIGVGVAMGAISTPIVAIAAAGAAFAVLYKNSSQFRDTINTIAQILRGVLKTSFDWLTSTALPALRTGFQIAWNAAGAAVSWFVNGPLAWIKQQLAGFASWYNAHAQQIATITRAAWAVVSTEIRVAWTVISNVVRVEAGAVVSILRIAWGLVRDGVRMAWDATRDIVKTALSVIIDAVATFVDLFTGHWGRAWNDAKKLVSDALHGITQFITDFGSNAANLLYDAGKNVIQGFINGVKSSFGAVQNVLGDLTKMLPSWKGPETVDKTILTPAGRAVIDGFIRGIKERRAALKSELSSITAEIAAIGNKISAAQQFSSSWMGNVFSGAMQGVTAGSSPTLASPTGGVFSISSLASTSSGGTPAFSPLQSLLDYAQHQSQQAQALTLDITKLRKMGATTLLLQQLQNAGPDAYPAIDALANSSASNVATLNNLLGSATANTLNAGAQLNGASSFKSLVIQQKDDQHIERLLQKVLHEKKIPTHDQAALDQLAQQHREEMAQIKALIAAVNKQTQTVPSKTGQAVAKAHNHTAKRAKNR